MADRAESGYLDNEGETDFQVAKTFPPTVRPGEALLWKQVWLDSLWIIDLYLPLFHLLGLRTLLHRDNQ